MSEYELLDETEAYEVGRRDGRLIAACRCGEGVDVPDTGLGRAVIGAWKTQHQEH